MSFYLKEKTLSEVSARVKMGFHNFQKHEKLLKPKSIENFLKFSQEPKSVQKDYLTDDSEAIMDALFDIIKCLNSDRDLMEFVLPTIDAILIEERAVLREVVESIKGQKNNFLSTLKSILVVEDHAAASFESAARISSVVLGELPRETHQNEQKAFTLELLNIRKREGKRQKVSDFGLSTCFVHLNKHA